MNIQLLVALFVLSSAAYARDYGVLGTVYPIQEQDIIEVMKAKMAAKVSDGTFDSTIKKMQEQGKNYVKRPKGITLPPAKSYNATKIDVEYTLDKNIQDGAGKVLFFKGTTVNPLEIYPLRMGFCFIDGDRQEQVKWAKKMCYPNNKVVLVNGNYETVAKALNVRVYFDQQGSLIRRFNIESLPTVIRQRDNYLVKEVFPVAK